MFWSGPIFAERVSETNFMSIVSPTFHLFVVRMLKVNSYGHFEIYISLTVDTCGTIDD